MNYPISNARPKIIIIEGCDRTGKTTLVAAINKLLKYKHLTIDRGPVGFKAYCEIFNKDYALYDSYVRMEDELAKNPDVVMIYLYAPLDVLEQRVKDTNHEYIDYEQHLPIYRKHFARSTIENRHAFDTSKATPEGIVKALVRQGIL